MLGECNVTQCTCVYVARNVVFSVFGRLDLTFDLTARGRGWQGRGEYGKIAEQRSEEEENEKQ